MLTHQQETLLQFVRRTLWQENLPLQDDDWNEIETLAGEQGVLWMLYPGSKSAQAHIPQEKRTEWRSACISGVFDNQRLNAFQEEWLQWLAGKKIRAAVLKGTSCSRYYAFPNMRPLGDIDILVDPENVDEAASDLQKRGFVESTIPHGFHRGFSLNGITIEVHVRCSELPRGTGADAAMRAEKTYLDEIQMAEMEGMRFPVLTQEHQALMLLMHMERHMQEDGLGLRQLCDWAAFVHGSDSARWEGAASLLKSCGLYQYACVVTWACVKYLGLQSACAAWAEKVDDSLMEAFMQDVFARGSFGKADDQHAGSLFSDRSAMGKKGQGALQGMLAKMTSLAHRKYPITRRCAILLPVFYLYIPVNYVVRSLFGKGTRRDLRKTIANSKKRQRLYGALHLYEVEE